MARKYLDDNGLLYFWNKIKALLNNKVDVVSGKGLSTNDFTTAYKNKLDGIEAQANKTVVDSALSSTSENPVQNKVINSALGGKVDAVSGKGLSTNDFTTAYKNKLDGIASGAEVNAINTIKVNGTAQTITSKAVNITVPTNNNQLTNGAGYQTSSQVQSAIDTALSGITGIDFQIVENLPATGTKGVIYLKAHSHGTGDIYDEYIWITNGSSGSYEKIGSTDIDLSHYLKDTDVVAISNAEIDTIVV